MAILVLRIKPKFGVQKEKSSQHRLAPGGHLWRTPVFFPPCVTEKFFNFYAQQRVRKSLCLVTEAEGEVPGWRAGSWTTASVFHHTLEDSNSACLTEARAKSVLSFISPDVFSFLPSFSTNTFLNQLLMSGLT